jgi:hypothetical protein
MGTIFKRFFSLFKFNNFEVYIYSHDFKNLIDIQKNDIETKLFNNENRDSLLEYNMKIKKNMECVLAFYKNELAHESSIYFKSFLLSKFGFNKKIALIGNCITYNKFKGLGIYPYVLNKIIIHLSKKLNHKIAYIMVSTDNVSSIKGIEKAGFTRILKLSGVKFLFFVFNKKKNIFNENHNHSGSSPKFHEDCSNN